MVWLWKRPFTSAHVQKLPTTERIFIEITFGGVWRTHSVGFEEHIRWGLENTFVGVWRTHLVGFGEHIRWGLRNTFGGVWRTHSVGFGEHIWWGLENTFGEVWRTQVCFLADSLQFSSGWGILAPYLVHTVYQSNIPHDIKSQSWNRGVPMESRRGHILLAVFCSMRVLPTRLAFQLRDFALHEEWPNFAHSHFIVLAGALLLLATWVSDQFLCTRFDVQIGQSPHQVTAVGNH